MSKDEAILFAQKVTDLDAETCGTIVQSLMMSRTLSKVIRDLDKLAADKEHKALARSALRKLGFELE